jgi:hypothetical protein
MSRRSNATRKAFVAALEQVEHRAAAQRFAGGGAAQDIAVTAHGHYRLAQLDLQPAFFAGQQLFAAQQAQAGQDLGRADKELDFGVVVQRLGHIGQQAEAHVQAAGGLVVARVSYHAAALDGFHVHARDVDGGAAAGHGLVFFAFVGLQTAHAPAQASRQDLDFVAQAQAAVAERAGDDGAEAGHGEDAVYGQARLAQVRAGGALGQAVAQGLQQVRQALAGARGDAHDGGLFEHGAAQGLADIVLHQV